MRLDTEAEPLMQMFTSKHLNSYYMSHSFIFFQILSLVGTIGLKFGKVGPWRSIPDISSQLLRSEEDKVI